MHQNVRKWSICIALGVIVWLASLNVYADEQGDRKKIPQLIEHSRPNFTVYQGDKINLSVNAKGADLLYRWIRNYKTICRKAACSFDSAKWGVGRQSLTVVVYNRFGSRSVNFMIRLLARPTERAKEEITPRMVEAADVETVTNDDYFIRALNGIGYAYKSKDVKIVGKVARLLSWEEKIRTHVKGVVHFGIKDQEEMILMPSGNVLLAKAESGKRAIILRRGILRARQISPARPAWSVLVDNWVQVDGDMNADLVIERKNATQVSVTALRGNARVFFRKTVDQPLNEGQAVVVPVGTTVDLEQGYDPGKYHKPLYKFSDQIIRGSSPQYFLKAQGTKHQRKGMFLSPNIQGHKDKSLSQSLIDAEKYLADEDYFMALENLLPVFAKGNASYRYNLSVAHAYRNLQLFRPALRFYLIAREIDPENGEPDFEIGLMYVEAKMWSKAEKHLVAAKDKQYKNHQLVNYYLGVCQFNQDNKLAAKVAFEYSLWEARNKDIKQSSLAFLQRLGSDQIVGAIGSLGIGFDSNVYRWGKGQRTDSYATESGIYYHALGSLYYRPFNDAEGFFKLAFEADKKGFVDADLKDIETLTQRVSIDWQTNFGIDENYRSDVTLRLQPFVEIFAYGEERSADTYGLTGELGNQTWGWEPRLLVGYTFMLDPLPGRDDKLDPILQELVSPSDRSAVSTWYGLGLSLMKSPDFQLGLEGVYKLVERRSEVVKIDNFNEVFIRFPALVMVNPEVRFSLAPGYLQRTFAESDDDRADSAYFIGMGMTYYYSPAFYNEFRAQYRNQSSNRDVAAFNQYQAGLYFTLEL